MPDISAFASALTSLNAAKDIAQAMIGLRDTAAFQTKLIEFQRKLIEANNAALAAQEERSVLLARIATLEQQVARLETWHTEKQNYELKEVASGAFAYVLKQSARGSEPEHWLCAQCYQNNKKSILQVHRRDVSYEYHQCSECHAEVRVEKLKFARPVVTTARRNPLARWDG